MKSALLVILGLLSIMAFAWVFYRLGPMASGWILTGHQP